MDGITTREAEERQTIYGLNVLPEEAYHPFALFLAKFWAPIPWVLESIILLEIGVGKRLEAGIIFLLLLFNVMLSFFQEGRAKKALDLLKSQLDVRARVLRDKIWRSLSAKELVPGDLMLVRMGDIIPADGKIIQGKLSIDQSTLTGESLSVEAGPDQMAYAGSIAQHGEAFVRVVATGKNSYFGKTAEIVSTAKAPTHLERMIFLIVKYLIQFDVVLISAIAVYSFYQALPLVEIIPFSLLLLVASVPVALPATFTLATSLGSLELSHQGVLATRLAAIEEAAAMNVLCLDKTGTITKNFLEVSASHTYSSFTQDDLLCLAGFASEEATQDPIDLAILSKAKHGASFYASAERSVFIPFDPERKFSEAILNYQKRKLRVLKGAPHALSADPIDVEKLAQDGSRVLAVAIEIEGNRQLAGLIALKDWPREDSARLIQELKDLGIRLIMITGDDIATARTIAKMVGLGTKALSKSDWEKESAKGIFDVDVIAGVLPEDKLTIVAQLQNSGYICGMTGDGVNDAPALRKAEVGIAVANATDVAKAAASIVLTKPGLSAITEAVKVSRRIYQRMLTYTLNKITKTLDISILLGIGLILVHDFVISQLLIVLLLFTNDFVTMSIATDRVSFSQTPDRWNVKRLIKVGASLASLILLFSFSILFIGENGFSLSIESIRTLVFLMLVFTGQATIYLVRERKAFWHSNPSVWMVAISILDILIVTFLAINGIFMAPLSIGWIAALLGLVIVYFLALDLLKGLLNKISPFASEL